VTQVAQFMGHKDPSVTLVRDHVVDDVQRLMGQAAASLLPGTADVAGAPWSAATTPPEG